ncbi:MBL fold metallo-hydrolase [Ectobacillus sp. JY-23]|uniref:MBL fold metallo-hydrolase n=1 Tax=Ectobacillus sp. JY-23 TaxID=2933872 RepID=UPI00248C50E1|nr:MBL fold metallo-hydrolase [Ectobacillus sp. JY-23]
MKVFYLLALDINEPEWFMKHVHMTPEESVRAYKDLGATYFIPMHYGAFALADETPQEALERLTTAWESHQLPPKYLHVLLHGQTLCYNEIKDHTKFALHV